MDESAQGTVIAAIAIGGVEADDAGGAEAAEALGVQRAGIEERRAALRATVFGLERLRCGEAGVTDGDKRKGGERLVAEAAIVGKKTRKEGRAGLGEPDERGGRGEFR
ncbi:MAG TPA: hypothetical protein VGK29_21670 [Paludibaculum sp.]|jgi:hypothetical protein